MSQCWAAEDDVFGGLLVNCSPTVHTVETKVTCSDWPIISLSTGTEILLHDWKAQSSSYKNIETWAWFREPSETLNCLNVFVCIFIQFILSKTQTECVKDKCSTCPLSLIYQWMYHMNRCLPFMWIIQHTAVTFIHSALHPAELETNDQQLKHKQTRRSQQHRSPFLSATNLFTVIFNGADLSCCVCLRQGK